MNLTREECEKALGVISDMLIKTEYLNGKPVCYYPIGEDEQDVIYQLIEEHFNDNNTAEFKHFKLHSDGTLKSMTKDGLISYIHMLYHNWQATDEAYQNVMNFARKLSDNSPLKFEELHEGMWVWDDERKKFIKIVNVIHDDESTFLIVSEDDEYDLYEENRFYRKQVE